MTHIPEPTHYTFVATSLLINLVIGLATAAAHLSFLSQVRGLVGQRGIMPAIHKQQQQNLCVIYGIFRYLPATDTNLIITLIAGVIASSLQVAAAVAALWFPSCNSSSAASASFSLAATTTTTHPFWLCSGVSFLTWYSIREVSDRFMGLQMHAMLLELNFWNCLLAVCGNSTATAAAFQFLCCRLMVGGGIGKLCGGDPAWNRAGGYSAMSWHYWTMPLPNPLSRSLHFLPDDTHKLEVYATLLVEGPLGLLGLGFFPWWMRVTSFLGTAGLLFMINVSGNFGFLWIASLAAAVASLDDKTLLMETTTVVLHIPRESYNCAAAIHEDSRGLLLLLSHLRWFAGFAVAAVYCLVQLVPFAATYSREIPFPAVEAALSALRRVWFVTLNVLKLDNVAASFWRWLSVSVHQNLLAQHSICNRYVKFGSMTRFRFEVTLEVCFEPSNSKTSSSSKSIDTGSSNNNDNDNKAAAESPIWFRIPFRYKPSGPSSTPRWVPPCHLPSLDWFMWFIPLQIMRGNRTPPQWLVSLMQKIKAQEPCVLALLDVEEMQRGGFFDFSHHGKIAAVRAVLEEFVYVLPTADEAELQQQNEKQINNERDMQRALQVTPNAARLGPLISGDVWQVTRILGKPIAEI